jgi:hypothetical protein
MGTFKVLVRGQTDSKTFLIRATQGRSGLAYCFIIRQRICGRQAIRMFDIPQEMVSQGRIGASGVPECLRPGRFVKILEKKECLSSPQIERLFWCKKGYELLYLPAY